MQYTKLKILIILVCCSYPLIISPSAFAHKVNIFAYVEGDTVYTESYFPDGKKVEGGRVEVYDSRGKKLLEGTTDDEGQFNFRPPRKDDLEIIINASMGHRSSYTLSADEFSVSGRKEIMEKRAKLEQEKVSHREVIGGIGYIFGIAGIIFYFLSKKKK